MECNSCDNPFDSISPTVQEVLVAAGWNPGRLRPWWKLPQYLRNDRQWLEFASRYLPRDEPAQNRELHSDALKSHPARRVLAELYGLIIRSMSKDVLISRLHFIPITADPCANEIAGLSSALNMFLIPIGEIRSESHVLVDVSGKVFSLGIPGEGVFFDGESLGAALDSYVRGVETRPVIFDETVDSCYRLTDVTRDHPLAYFPKAAQKPG